jgi:very-short-patch-repair endonuclease
MSWSSAPSDTRLRCGTRNSHVALVLSCEFRTPTGRVKVHVSQLSSTGRIVHDGARGPQLGGHHRQREWMQPPRIPLPPPLSSAPFTPATAREHGINRGRLRGRDLEHPFRGVYVTSLLDLEVIDLCAALATRVPSNAFFCGPTAAKLYGIPLPRRLEFEYTTHVAVPAPATAPVGRGVSGHSYRVVDREIVTLRGLRVGSPERTWCELSTVLSLDELIAAGDFLIHHKQGVTNRSKLAEQVRVFPARRGRITRAAALLELHDRSESPRETELRLLLTRSGLPGLRVNLEIRTRSGHDYRADLAFAEKRVIIEYQSHFHDSPTRQVRDRSRRSRLQADGWLVIEVSSEDLRNPLELVERIRRTLAPH